MWVMLIRERPPKMSLFIFFLVRYAPVVRATPGFGGLDWLCYRPLISLHGHPVVPAAHRRSCPTRLVALPCCLALHRQPLLVPSPPPPPPRPPLRSATMGTSPEPSKPTLCYLDTTTPPPAAPPLAGRTSPGGRPRIQHAYTCLDEINKVLFQKGAYPVKTTIVVVCGNYENSKHDYMMLIRWLEKRGDVIL